MQSPLVLQVTCDASRVSDCADALQARLPTDQWSILVALAAEVVTRHESVTAGCRILVVPARELESAVKVLRVAPVR